MTLGQIASLVAAEVQSQRIDVASIDPDPLPAKLKIKVDPYGQ